MCHAAITGYDNPPNEPAAGRDGWLHFGLCSFLLAQDDYCTFGPVDITMTVDFGVTSQLGSPTAARDDIGAGDYVLMREYDHGYVVVNGDSSGHSFYPASLPSTPQTVYEESTGTPYGTGQSFTLYPHTGRIFFF